MYEYKNVKGHIEVYYNGEFLFTSDNYAEAEKDIKEYEMSKGVPA